MNDAISRLAVIQIIEKMRARIAHNLERSVGRAMIEILDDVGRDVDRLPSALGTNLAEVGTDCISRQQAIDIAKDLTITVEGYEMHNQAVLNYCADIMQLPPIQPEIVRCKDCQDYQTDWNPSGKTGRHYCATMDSFMLPDGFCSYAERREVTT